MPWIPQAENMVAAVAAKHSAPECASQCLHRRTYNRLPAGLHTNNVRVKSVSRQPEVSTRSGTSRRGPRAWSQIHCIFHDPRRRGVSCSSTAFRRSPFGLHQIGFRHRWRLRQWSLHHPLGVHRNPFSLFLAAFHLSSERREHILV